MLPATGSRDNETVSIPALMRVLPAVALGTLLAVLPACSAPSPDHAADQPPKTTPTPSEPAPSTGATAEDQSPEVAFRTWLAASREPDAAVACSYLTDALVERMLAEMKASGWPVTDCAAMTESTAELYKATGQSQDVEIDTITVTADAAELHVAYIGGSCGRVVMERATAHWVMNEYSEESC